MDTQHYPTAFKTAFAHLLILEGGFVNDPDDKGGVTHYGLSTRANPEIDIASLTQAQAQGIYWEKYWCANHCDQLPQPLAFALFDGVVNHRAITARRLLQKALGVNPDGVLGPVSLRVAAKADGKQTLSRYFAARANLYHQLIQANSSQAKFAMGWFKRLFKVQQFILQECWPWLP